MTMQCIAGMATIPARGHLLERVLTRLRPQVDCLAVYLGQYTEVPQCVSDLADQWLLDPKDVHGSEGKLAWTRSFDGLYLSVDDDMLYPVNYRKKMQQAVERFDNQVIVAAQGAVFPKKFLWFTDPAVTWMRWNKTYTEGRWLSMPAGGFVAHHTSLYMPDVWPERNADDHQIAVWAQERKIPVWGLPHSKDWFEYLLPLKDKTVYTIYREEKATGFARRNRILSTIPNWTLYRHEQGATSVNG